MVDWCDPQEALLKKRPRPLEHSELGTMISPDWLDLIQTARSDHDLQPGEAAQVDKEVRH